MSNRPQRQQKPAQQPHAHSGQILRAQKTTIYQGQLPPPDMLEKFEAIQPGFTDRLLKMVEAESEFKRGHDRDMLKSFKLSTVLGMVSAFLSVVVVSCVAVFAIYKGFSTAAATIMSTTAAAVIIAFLQRKNRSK